jgi:Na+/H+-dicarboxylate symporter
MNLTTRIFIGMAAGIATGVGINAATGLLGAESSASVFIGEWFTDGLLAVLGQGFMRLLTVLVIPLVFVSLVCGTAALDDIRKLGRIGGKSLGLYLATTAIAISLAMGLAALFGPGRGFDLETDATFETPTPPPLRDVFVALIPNNIFTAMAEGQMLQIIIFAILLGIAITLSGEPGQRILAFFGALNEVVLKLVGIIMLVAPYGVFALVARTFAGEGFAAFPPLMGYFLTVLAALLIHVLVTYPVLLKLLAGLNPVTFMKKLRDVHLFAFSTASSNATIPITLRTVENRLGASNSIASFTVPLGATINMDGTAIMQGVATIFIAQAYNIPLGLADLAMVILTATLASIGTAGVPGVGLIMLGMVLKQVGLPVEGIALIIGIDRLLDMIRTAVNVTGDAMVTCIISKGENQLDMAQFRSR